MHLPLCAVTGHLQPAKGPSASSLCGERGDGCPQLSMTPPPLGGGRETQVSVLNPSVRAYSEKLWAWGLGDQPERCPHRLGRGQRRWGRARPEEMTSYGFFLADSEALNSLLQGSQAGGKVGTTGRAGTHLRNASWLLRWGKKEGSQTSPRSRQASVQALPGAASQARREWGGGQAPAIELMFWAHSRWVALGAKTKGLWAVWAPGGAGLGPAQKSCQKKERR